MAKKIQKYTLVGCDGNAFAIMGYVYRAFDETEKIFDRPHHITEANKENYRMLATSGDYNNLLCISMKTLEDLNEDLEKGGFLSEDSEDAVEMIAKLTAMGYNVTRTR